MFSVSLDINHDSEGYGGSYILYSHGDQVVKFVFDAKRINLSKTTFPENMEPGMRLDIVEALERFSANEKLGISKLGILLDPEGFSSEEYVDLLRALNQDSKMGEAHSSKNEESNFSKKVRELVPGVIEFESLGYKLHKIDTQYSSLDPEKFSIWDTIEIDYKKSKTSKKIQSQSNAFSAYEKKLFNGNSVEEMEGHDWGDVDVLFRGDGRAPWEGGMEIFRNGFVGNFKGDSDELINYLANHSGEIVSASSSAEVAASFPLDSRGRNWVYVIRKPADAIDIKEEGLYDLLDKEGEILLSSNEKEVSLPSGVGGEDILGVQATMDSKAVGPFIYNPHYKKR